MWFEDGNQIPEITCLQLPMLHSGLLPEVIQTGSDNTNYKKKHFRPIFQHKKSEKEKLRDNNGNKHFPW